jgi:hypothetical protein
MSEPGGAPALLLPFGGGRGDHEALVRDRARAIRLRLAAEGLGRFVQSDDAMTDLICRTSPRAGADTIGLVADWLLWLFPLDDLCEHVFATSAAAETVPAGDTGLVSRLSATALPRIVTTGMADFCTAVTARMSSGWGERFRRDLDRYLVHAIRHAGTSTVDDLPELDDFLVLRREEGAAKPTIDLIEVAVRADLPEAFRGSPAWRQLHNACADVLTWCNDIYSYRKERYAGNRFNLIDVLARHDQLSEQDAHSRAVGMVNRKAQEFVAGAARLVHSAEFSSLTEDARSDVLRCVEGMQYWMRGQYDWFVITCPARYQVPAHR